MKVEICMVCWNEFPIKFIREIVYRGPPPWSKAKNNTISILTVCLNCLKELHPSKIIEVRKIEEGQ